VYMYDYDVDDDEDEDEEDLFFFVDPPQQHLHIHILTYDVRTAMAGSIEVPKRALPQYCKVSNLHLASSPDGRLSLHVANKLKISVLLQRPAGAGGWSRHAVIDIATTARSLTPPGTPYYWWLKGAVDFARRGAAPSCCGPLPATTGLLIRWRKRKRLMERSPSSTWRRRSCAAG